MTTRIIEVLEADPHWAADFQAEKKLLETALSGLRVSVHHIGSTSVPGLAAKPIIDILLECESVEQLDHFNSRMQAIGYTPKGEWGIERRRYFGKGGVQHSHHVHAFRFDDPHVVRHLAFRDYLIAHPDVAADYQRIKRDAVSQADNSIERYMALKSDFIKHYEQEALNWFHKPESS